MLKVLEAIGQRFSKQTVSKLILLAIPFAIRHVVHYSLICLFMFRLVNSLNNC